MSDNTLLSPIQVILRLADREAAFYRLASLYLKGPKEAREEIRKQWDFGVDWVYPNPRRLACTTNEAYSSRERALALLAYNAILDLRQGDARDHLLNLAVVYHGCLAAGLEPRSLFAEVASLSSSRAAGFLHDFLERSPEDRSLEAFMLISSKNADGEIEIYPS